MAQGLPGDVENRRGRDPDCVLEGKLASVPKVPESDEETKQLAREGPSLLRAQLWWEKSNLNFLLSLTLAETMRGEVAPSGAGEVQAGDPLCP